MRARRHVTALALAASLSLAVHPAYALTTYADGVADNPFHIADVGEAVIVSDSGDESITLENDVISEIACEDPRSVQGLPNGNILFASRDKHAVYEITSSGAVVWTYTPSDYQRFDTTFDPARDTFEPFHANRFTASDGTQHTLITVRRAFVVIEVDENKDVVWQYGVTGESGYVDGYAVGELYDPFSATRLPNDNRLIADNQGCRVIEVNPAGEIVWQYGIGGENASDHGYAAGYLGWPRTAYRFTAPDGSQQTLIADENAQRVIIVRNSDYNPTAPNLGYSASSIVWEYGVPGVSGSEPGYLDAPSCAIRMSDDSVLIANGGWEGRIDHVGPDGALIGRFVDEPMVDIRSLAISAGGSLLVADQSNERILSVAPTTSTKVTSQAIDCGLPGVEKRYTAIAWSGDAPPDTSVAVYYSIDGGTWTLAGSENNIVLPDGANGTFIRYRLAIKCDAGLEAPVVDDITISCEAITEEPGGDTDGDGTDTSDATNGDATPNTTNQTSGSGLTASKSKSTGGALVAVADQPEEVTISAAEIRGVYSGFALNAVVTDQVSGGSTAMRTRLGGLGFLGALYLTGLISEPLRRLLVRG